MVTTTTGLATSFITFTRTSNATVTDSNGFIKWAGHNLLTNSESFDASAWGKYLTTVTANSTVAPNGTTTADTVATTSTNATIYQSGVIPVGTSTFSCWFKAGSLTAVTLIYDGGSSTGRQATFTLTGSGSASAVTNLSSGGGTFSGGTASITPLADGWYLCTLANVTTTAAGAMSILLATSGNVIAWGAHLYRSDLGGMVLNPARGDAYYPTTPRNLIGYTEDLTNAAWTGAGTNAFGSGSVANAIIAPNGLQTADLLTENMSNTEHYRQQLISKAAVNGVYTATVYFKAGTGARNLRIGITDGSFGGYGATFSTAGAVVQSSVAIGVTTGWTAGTAAVDPVGDGWYRARFTATTNTATAVAIVLYIVNGTTGTYPGDGTSGIYLWGAQLSDSASLDAYSPVYGAAVTSAAYYAPRLDYDPVTLAALGLLVEEQRTNLVILSDQIDSWSKTNVTTTANSVSSPDGTVDADTFTSTTTSGIHIVNPASMSFTSGTSYTTSIFAKQGTGRYLQLLFGTAAFPNTEFANFDLQTGTVSGGDTADATITNCGNGWYRCTYRGVANATASDDAYVGIITTGTAVRAEVHSQALSYYGYGMQVEAGSFATSYIPTGASTATRTADVASVSTQAFPYSATEGTLVATGTMLFASSSSQTYAHLGDNNNGTQLFSTKAANRFNGWIFSGGNLQKAFAYTAAGSPNANTIYKIGAALKAADFAMSVNGNTVDTHNAGVMPVGVSTLSIGNQVGGISQINGHIRQITYLPRRITNAELVSRTS